MTRGNPRPEGPEHIVALEDKESKFTGLIAPGVYAFGSVRPMNRIRAYTSAGLGPFAGRGAPSEYHLLGHVHTDDKGNVERIEGFNGAEGERWAKQAHQKLVARGAWGPSAKLAATAPLKGCPHTGVR